LRLGHVVRVKNAASYRDVVSEARVKTLWLLRHAKASAGGDGLADRDRPLNGRGRENAELVGRHLAARGAHFDLVLCSSSLRTRETADLVAKGFGAPLPIEFEDALYLASERDLRERIQDVSDDVASLVLIGHNPGIAELALQLGRALDTRGACRHAPQVPDRRARRARRARAALAPLRARLRARIVRHAQAAESLGYPGQVDPHREIELKLEVSPEDLRRLQRHPLVRSLSQARAVTQTLDSVYFDTEDHDLAEANWVLRVRSSGPAPGPDREGRAFGVGRIVRAQRVRRADRGRRARSRARSRSGAARSPQRDRA
jgi:phosphohistidine phosphatase